MKSLSEEVPRLANRCDAQSGLVTWADAGLDRSCRRDKVRRLATTLEALRQGGAFLMSVKALGATCGSVEPVVEQILVCPDPNLVRTSGRAPSLGRMACRDTVKTRCSGSLRTPDTVPRSAGPAGRWN